MEGVVPSLTDLQQELHSVIEDPEERKTFFEKSIGFLITEPVSDAAYVSNLNEENL